MYSRRWGRVIALERGVKPPNTPCSTVQTLQRKTQLLLFIVSARHAHSRKWLVKCYLFGEAEAAWSTALMRTGDGWMEVLGRAEQRQFLFGRDEGVYSDVYVWFYVWEHCCQTSKVHGIPSSFLRNKLLSIHSCNSWKKAYTFLCPLDNRRTCGTLRGASVEEVTQYLATMSRETLSEKRWRRQRWVVFWFFFIVDVFI